MRKNIFAVSLVSIVMMASCAKSQPDNQTKAKQVTNQMFDAFNQHDASALAALYAKDAIVITPESCEPTIGRDGIAHNYEGLFNQVPDVQVTVEHMIAENGLVAVSFIASSQIEGAAFELPIAAFLTIENGTITKDVGYFNSDQDINCE